MSFGLLSRHMVWFWALPLACAALLAVAFVAARDVGPRAADAQSPPLYDDFNSRDRWYNDCCAGPDLFPLERTYTTTGATTEPGENAPCALIGSTIWIEYTPDRDGLLTLDTAGSTFDTVLAVYIWDLTGDLIPSPPGAKLVEVACNDSPAEAAALSFPLIRGQQVFIQLGGSNGASGQARLHGRCDCRPPNDDFQEYFTEIYVAPDQPESTVSMSTLTATVESGEPRPCGAIGATVWYALYVDSPTSTIQLDTSGSNFDTVIAVYKLPTDFADWPAQLGDLDLVACEDDGTAPASLVVNTDQFTQYYVQAGGSGGATGQLSVAARCLPVCPPYNDSIATAEWWEPPSEFCCTPTAGATLESGEPRPCGDIGATVWYRITARGDTTLVVDSAESDYETALAVYEGSGEFFGDPPYAELDLVTCRASSAAGRARLEFDAKANVPYWLQAGGRDGATGQLAFTLDCTPAPCPPFHDTIQNPYGFDKPYGEPYEDVFDVRGATVEQGEPLGCGDMGYTTWWVHESYEGSPAIPFVFDTANSTHDTSIAVYEAPIGVLSPDGNYAASFDHLREIACEPGAAGADAQVVFAASPGHRYYVQVGGRDGASGDLHVTISCDGGCPPDNDNVATAWTAPIGYQQFTDTRAATTETGESLPCGNIGKTIWYHLPAPVPGEFMVSTVGSDFPTAIAVYAVKGFSPPGGLEYVGCASGEALTFRTDEGISYYIQIGGVDGAGGGLQTRVDCIAGCAPTSPPGGIAYGVGGAIGGPDTGSGGYLSGARPD